MSDSSGVRTHHEVELTFRSEPDAVVPDLRGVPGIATVGEPATARLEAAYFDTADGALLRAGVTLRRRTGGGDAGWHLKTPLGAGREERQLPLSRSRRVPPKPLREAVLGWTRGAELGAVARIVTERTTRELRDADGVVLAEVADDVVVGTPVAGRGEGEVVRWREWEVELVDGGPAVLEAVAEVLEAAGAAADPGGRKIVRALGAPVPAHAPLERPGRGRPAQRVLHAWIAEQVAEIARRDYEIRRGDDGVGTGVHKARVACRRLRGALATYRPLVDREVTDPIRAELRWLAHTLGPVRDLDVAHERLRALVEEEPAGCVVGPVRRRLGSTYGVRRREALAAAGEALESDRYYALRDALDRLVAAPPWTETAWSDAREVLPKRVRREYRRVRGRVETATGSAGPERDEAMHAARRAAKRLRYAAEALEPVWGSDAKRLAKAAKTFASRLGTRQDAVVAGEDLLVLARAADAAGESTFTYGRLHAQEQGVGEKVDDALEQLWAQLSRKKLRRWL